MLIYLKTGVSVSNLFILMVIGKTVLTELSESYDELISWAELHDNAKFEMKKMIVNCLIHRVEVYSNYKIKIDFNFDFQQFIEGIDSIE